MILQITLTDMVLLFGASKQTKRLCLCMSQEVPKVADGGGAVGYKVATSVKIAQSNGCSLRPRAGLAFTGVAIVSA